MRAVTASSLVWLNRQRVITPRDLSLPRVQSAVANALSGVLEAQKKDSVLGDCLEITLVLVSDRRIAELHGQFMDDPTPTDVITFLHGEIVISVETAHREARARSLPVPQEVARYAVHGLLHLAGWADKTMVEARAMRAVQEKILRRAGRVLW
jgi:probable rRNA maturation factor